MKKLLFAALLFCFFTQLNAQVSGTWKTIDDDTNEAKSYVQLSESNGNLSGKIVKLLKSAADKKCDNCPGERKGQPLMNMVVVEGMKLTDGYFQDGKILDPEKGKWYTCKMWRFKCPCCAGLYRYVLPHTVLVSRSIVYFIN